MAYNRRRGERPPCLFCLRRLCFPYRYFMVFKNRELNADGAYTMDRFLEVMREL